LVRTQWRQSFFPLAYLWSKLFACYPISNLNEWIQEGIPFCTGENATRLLEKFRADQLEKQAHEASTPPTPAFNRRHKIELTRTEDKDFHARAMASLREWLDAAILPSREDLEGASFLLPPCNSFLRRALYESIPSEYPNLVLETVHETSQIRVWRLNSEERKRRNQRLLREGFEKVLVEKVGVWRVFLALVQACTGTCTQNQAEYMALSTNVQEAMGQFEPCKRKPMRRKIPLVVHNGMQDILFLLTHFHGALPENWKECKHLIHSYFPVVYDTKIMANEYCDREIFGGRTHLAAVFEQTLLRHPQWNRVFYVNGQAQLHEQLHDAGYDSYW
jgi:poly(A)-specific ribonuclease